MQRQLIATVALLATLAGCGVTPTLSAQPNAMAELQAERARGHKAPAKDAAAHPTSAKINTENFSQVSGFLYRGGVPQDADMTALKQLGITTDVNLLGGGGSPLDKQEVVHEAAVAKSLGINFINLPVPFNVPFPRAMADTFLNTVVAESQIPGHAVYVHCTHGRDRTGTMVGYYRIEHDHYTPAQAIAEMETFGFQPKQYPTFVAFLQGLGN